MGPSVLHTGWLYDRQTTDEKTKGTNIPYCKGS